MLDVIVIDCLERNFRSDLVGVVRSSVKEDSESHDRARAWSCQADVDWRWVKDNAECLACMHRLRRRASCRHVEELYVARCHHHYAGRRGSHEDLQGRARGMPSLPDMLLALLFAT